MPRRALEALSLPLLLLVWQGLAMLLGQRLFPPPVEVGEAIWRLAADGRLLGDLAQTLVRATIAFLLAMVIGTALGIALGRQHWLDRLLSAWLVVGLNLPAIVVAIVLFIWLGLSEVALILAVVINKVPLVTATVREGVRNLSPDYDELARALRLGAWRRLAYVLWPQLLPFVLAAARTGLSLIWKIVLVFEVLGSDGGVGFRIGVMFQFFDVTGILAYTASFIAVVLAFDVFVLQPVERKVLRWRQPR